MNNSQDEQVFTPEETDRIFTELYEKHYKTVLRYVRSSLRNNNQMLIEDIVQDTFFEALHKINEVIRFNAVGWLVETARNKMCSYHRRASSRETYLEDCVEADLGRTEKQFCMTEWNMILDKALDEHERRLLEMYYVEGYSGKEIAEAENITVDNLKVRMHRLKKKLIDYAGLLCITLLFICLH